MYVNHKSSSMRTIRLFWSFYFDFYPSISPQAREKSNFTSSKTFTTPSKRSAKPTRCVSTPNNTQPSLTPRLSPPLLPSTEIAPGRAEVSASTGANTTTSMIVPTGSPSRMQCVQAASWRVGVEKLVRSWETGPSDQLMNNTIERETRPSFPPFPHFVCYCMAHHVTSIREMYAGCRPMGLLVRFCRSRAHFGMSSVHFLNEEKVY